MPIRLLFASMMVLACCASHKTVAPPPSEPSLPSPEAVAPKASACETHKAALRVEYCDPEEVDETCAADKLSCELLADFDGDGTKERVVIEALDDTITLTVLWAGGRTENLASATRPLKLAETDESFEDFRWLLHWSVLSRKDGGFFHEVGSRSYKVPIKGAEGDALVVSGGDAAAAVFLRDESFVAEHLGF